MPKMVYLREFHPHSFLHLSPSGQAFKLRDFSAPGETEGRIVRQQSPPEWTTDRVLRIAGSAEGRCVQVAEKPIDNYAYWHDQTLKLNEQIPIRSRRGDEGDGKIVVVVPPTGCREHLATIIATVTAAVAAAGILFWLKWR